MPFTATPSYLLPESVAKFNLSIETGWEGQNGVCFLSERSEGLHSELIIHKQGYDCVHFELLYSGDCIKECEGVRNEYILDKKGLTIKTKLINPAVNKIYFSLPLFFTNGKDCGSIFQSKNTVSVKMFSNEYRVMIDGDWHITEEIIANRNGQYRYAIISAQTDELTVTLKLN